jgi:hypothetical protein
MFTVSGCWLCFGEWLWYVQDGSSQYSTHISRRCRISPFAAKPLLGASRSAHRLSTAACSWAPLHIFHVPYGDSYSQIRAEVLQGWGQDSAMYSSGEQVAAEVCACVRARAVKRLEAQSVKQVVGPRGGTWLRRCRCRMPHPIATTSGYHSAHKSPNIKSWKPETRLISTVAFISWLQMASYCRLN